MPTGNLTLVKVHLNSVISMRKARYMIADIKNFYFNTLMSCYEYVCIWLDDILEEIIEQYALRNKVDGNGHVYIEVKKGMYGFPQAGILAQKLLEEWLNKHCY
jgi:hypothetical protein